MQSTRGKAVFSHLQQACLSFISLCHMSSAMVIECIWLWFYVIYFRFHLLHLNSICEFSIKPPIILKVQSVFVTVVVKLIQEFKCLNRKICFKVNWVHYSFYFCLFLSLLLCAHIAAKTPVHLWCMERQTYRSIMTNKSKKKREQLMGFLKTWVSRLSSHDKTFIPTPRILFVTLS